MHLFRTLILKASSHPWIECFVKKSFLFKPLVKRFIAGNTIEEAIAVAEKLIEEGFTITLDSLGENVASVEEIESSKNLYLALLKSIAKSKYKEKINISIKITQCGLDHSKELALKNYTDILEFATKENIFVRVDMEGSAYTKATLKLVEEAFKNGYLTGTVIQSYLYRTEEDAKHLANIKMRVRVAKGAYLEPKSIAYQNLDDIRRSFLNCSKELLKNGYYPAIATHDLWLIEKIKEFVTSENIKRSRFEFQTLFGISRKNARNLVKEGYNVRVYVPFGKSWYPYFTRRLAERPENLLFLLKSLFKN